MELDPLQKGRSLEDHESLRLEKSEKPCCNISRCTKLSFGLVFTVSLALCCIMWFTGLYWFLIQYRVTIRKDAPMFPTWVATPLTTKTCIYLYNYTNVPEFMSKEYPRLKVERVGPFCFREQPLKEKVEFKGSNLVEYDDSRTLKYWPEESNGNMSDIIVVPNISLLSTTTLASESVFTNAILALIPNDSTSQSPFLTLNISDYVHGWDDKVLNSVSDAGSIVGFSFPFTRSGVIPWLHGFLKVRMLAETGTRNTQRIGKILKINGQPKLRLWESKECNQFKGSDGVYFPPNDVMKGNPVYFYYVLMCRSLKLTKKKDVELQEGLMVPRYVMEEKTLEAPARNPENACYCRSKGYCYNTTDGLSPYDLKPCLGIPLLMTSPNVNLYSEDLFSHLEGYEMNVTDPSDFDTFFDVLPNLGITVRYMQNVQINLRLGNVKQFQNVMPGSNDRMLPMYYFKRTGDNLPKPDFKLMYEAQVKATEGEFMFKWLFLSIAFLSGVMSAFLISRSRIAKKQEAKFALK